MDIDVDVDKWHTPDLRGTEREVRYRLLKLRAPSCQKLSKTLYIVQ